MTGGSPESAVFEESLGGIRIFHIIFQLSTIPVLFEFDELSTRNSGCATLG